MKFFEKYLSPGACKCLPPRGGVGDQSNVGGGRVFLAGVSGDRSKQYVDHRNFIMTGTSVYQKVSNYILPRLFSSSPPFKIPSIMFVLSVITAKCVMLRCKV